ncbi:unnamed protein product [Amoebophrya sp. A120]|nr:unnamed protein product [Amoebophrya sp. A120]|eukprot:GSA120T00018748001.1
MPIIDQDEEFSLDKLQLADGVKANAAYTLYESLGSRFTIPKVTRENRFTGVRALPEFDSRTRRVKPDSDLSSLVDKSSTITSSDTCSYTSWAKQCLEKIGVYRLPDEGTTSRPQNKKAKSEHADKNLSEIEHLSLQIGNMREFYKNWRSHPDYEENRKNCREGMNKSPLHDDDDTKFRPLIQAAENHLQCVYNDQKCEGKNNDEACSCEVLFISYRTRGIGLDGKKTYLNHWHTDFDCFKDRWNNDPTSDCNNGEEVLEEFLLSWLPLWHRRAGEKLADEKRRGNDNEAAASPLNLLRRDSTAACSSTRTPSTVAGEDEEVPEDEPLFSSFPHSSAPAAVEQLQASQQVPARDVIRRAASPEEYENYLKKFRLILNQAEHDVCNLWFTLCHDQKAVASSLCVQSKRIWADKEQDQRLLDEYFSEQVQGLIEKQAAQEVEVLADDSSAAEQLGRGTEVKRPQELLHGAEGESDAEDDSDVVVVPDEFDNTKKVPIKDTDLICCLQSRCKETNKPQEVAVMFKSMHHSHRSCDLHYEPEFFQNMDRGKEGPTEDNVVQRNNFEARFLILHRSGLQDLFDFGTELLRKYF